MKYFIQKALADWAYRVNDGCPDPHNRTHIQVLENVLRQYGCTEQFISEYVTRVYNPQLVEAEEDEKYHHKGQGVFVKIADKDKADDDSVTKYEKTDDGKYKELEGDGESGEDSREHTKNMLLTPEPGSDAAADKSASATSDIDPGIQKGFDNLPKRLDRLKSVGVLGDADIAQLQNLQKDFSEFSKNPTKEVAEALIEKYKLSVSSNSKKLYVGVIAGEGRKALVFVRFNPTRQSISSRRSISVKPRRSNNRHQVGLFSRLWNSSTQAKF